MKTTLYALIVCFGTIIFSNHAYGHGPDRNKISATNQVKYLGKWKGEEICGTVSAPVAILYVIDNGQEVMLTGLYSMQGRVRATIKGDTLTIPRQEVKDPNFMNILVEGVLVYGTTPLHLSGNILVYNNQEKDECRVRYFRQLQP